MLSSTAVNKQPCYLILVGTSLRLMIYIHMKNTTISITGYSLDIYECECPVSPYVAVTSNNCCPFERSGGNMSYVVNVIRSPHLRQHSCSHTNVLNNVVESIIDAATVASSVTTTTARLLVMLVLRLPLLQLGYW